jgi:tripartite-type tricarboxylate transporter receptor subunit TctC
MNMTCRLFAAGMAFATLLLFNAKPGFTQNAYPTRLVKLIVPAAGGSTTDAIARILADQMTKLWGQTVIVENVAGGAMNVGAERVARAEPDGYTLFVSPPSPLAINQLLFSKLAYDPAQFVPITLLAKIPNVLVVRHDLPVKTLAELIAYGKANPGKLTYASQGVGSTAHLAASQLALAAGIDMVHVPYRGAMPALNDVLAGNVDFFFDTPTTSVPLYKAGKVRILAVADTVSRPSLPDVPTMAEAGLPGFRSITWFGLVAPPKTPPALAEKIGRAVAGVLHSPEVVARLEQAGLEAGGSDPAATKAFFAEETALWGKVIKETNIPVQ